MLSIFALNYAKMTSSPIRFHFLDVLRGLAAFVVVFWHWQHFYILGGGGFSPNLDISREPLSAVFTIFYRRGWLAVDLFFTLSGFIFYWIYAEAISTGRLAAGRFFMLRSSRLYPLHLATLLLVAAGQLVFKKVTGAYFVYQANDLYHFALNLGLASAWGLEMGYSFNGPVWSISVEILLYAAFFTLCRLLPIRWFWLMAASCAGLIVLYTLNSQIGRGLFSFFVGGLSYLAYARAVQQGHLMRLVRVVPPCTVFLWVAALIICGTQIQLLSAPYDSEFARMFCTVLLFPATIISLATIETRGAISIIRFIKLVISRTPAIYSIFLCKSSLRPR